MTNTSTSPDTIRRTETGSIDTAHYIARSHAIRSQAAHEGLSHLVTTIKRLLGRKTADVAALRSASRQFPAPRPVSRPDPARNRPRDESTMQNARRA